MPQYECAVVFNSTLSEEQIQQQIERVKTWIVGLGAEVTDVDLWGRKRLAYPIRKQREGYYAIYYFKLEEGRQRLPELEKRLNTAEELLRHLVVKLPPLKEIPRVPKAPKAEQAEVEAPEKVEPKGEKEPQPEAEPELAEEVPPQQENEQERASQTAPAPSE